MAGQPAGHGGITVEAPEDLLDLPGAPLAVHVDPHLDLLRRRGRRRRRLLLLLLAAALLGLLLRRRRVLGLVLRRRRRLLGLLRLLLLGLLRAQKRHNKSHQDAGGERGRETEASPARLASLTSPMASARAVAGFVRVWLLM